MPTDHTFYDQAIKQLGTIFPKTRLEKARVALHEAEQQERLALLRLGRAVRDEGFREGVSPFILDYLHSAISARNRVIEASQECSVAYDEDASK